MTGQRWAIVLVAAVVVISAGVAVHTARKQIRGLENQVASVNQTLAAKQEEIQRYGREVAALRGRAAAAAEQAMRAEERAERTAEARVRSEAETMQAQQAAEQARQQLLASRGELEALKQRRQQELDKMREALSRIAPTRRTASGMIVELSSDSFYFDFDKATLRPENREVLSRIAGVLLASNGYRLFVYGYTDDIGAREYNQDLSERRARAVSGYLQNAGVPAELIETKGFGKSDPRVKATTAAARQKNRRVEIGIVDTVVDYYGPVSGQSHRADRATAGREP